MQSRGCGNTTLTIFRKMSSASQHYGVGLTAASAKESAAEAKPRVEDAHEGRQVVVVNMDNDTDTAAARRARIQGEKDALACFRCLWTVWLMALAGAGAWLLTTGCDPHLNLCVATMDELQVRGYTTYSPCNSGGFSTKVHYARETDNDGVQLCSIDSGCTQYTSTANAACARATYPLNATALFHLPSCSGATWNKANLIGGIVLVTVVAVVLLCYMLGCVRCSTRTRPPRT